MSANWLEIAIILFIIGAISVILYFGWRGGASNPVSTGNLDDRLNSFKDQLSGVSHKVDDIEGRVETIEGHYAKASDIERLEKRLRDHDRKMDKLIASVGVVREEAAERGALAKSTAKQLDLIYRTIVEKGMSA